VVAFVAGSRHLSSGGTPRKESAILFPAAAPDRQTDNKREPAPRASLSPEEIFARGSPAVVQVLIQDRQSRTIGTGSGFLVSTNGLIATNYHVIRNADSARVVFSDDKTLPVVGVAATDEDADLAIIKVAYHFSVRPLELAEIELPPIGAKVYAIGNPLGLSNTLSDGLVSGHREIGQIPIIQTTAPISPGSSGGPLLTADGKVVGVTSSQFKSGQNLNFAIPVSQILRLMPRFEGEWQLTQLPLGRQWTSGPFARDGQTPGALPNRDDMAERVERIKAQLRIGMSNPAELEAIMGGRPDKSENVSKDQFITDLNARTNRPTIVRRYFPFEIPGVPEPRYRVNLFFQNSEDGKGYQLSAWYFRSIN